MGKQRKTIRNKRKIKVENYENNYIDSSIVEKKVTKAFTRGAQFTIISIFLVTIILISSAYAIFSSVQKQETYNTLTVGTLKIDFDQSSTDMGNIINLNGAYPISDVEGQATSPYSFKITNSGTLTAYYKIKIVDDTDMITEDGCQNNLLPKDKIKVSINGETPFLLSSMEANNYIVNDGNLTATESKIFEIRIWIDEAAGNEVLGKHYHGKIVVEGENKVEKQKAYKVGDVFTIDTEKFYVIEDSDETKDTVTGLAMYNLNVGDNKLSSVPEGLQNENVLGYVENKTRYGETIYGNSTSSYAGSVVENYVNSYVTKLGESVPNVSGRLLSKEEAVNFGCSINDHSCSNSPYPWLISSSFWTDSIENGVGVWAIKSNGNFTFYNILSLDHGFGVRPVITVSKTNLS